MTWPINERAEYLRENRPPEYWAQQDIDPFRQGGGRPLPPLLDLRDGGNRPIRVYDVPRWAVVTTLIALASVLVIILAMVQYLIFID
jgi:hypothetical protein